MTEETEAESAITTVVDGARVRHWMSGSYSPYMGMLHDPDTDDRINWQDRIMHELWKLPEGSSVSITLTYAIPREGEIDPGDVWVLYEPHHYGHADENRRKKGE